MLISVSSSPTHASVLQDKFVVQVATGRYFTMAVTDAGELYTWGLNDWGQLGRTGQVWRGGGGLDPCVH